MKILALEFSSPQRSVAVLSTTHPSENVVSEIVETGAGGVRTFGMIDAALRAAGVERGQIECVAVGLGPGSYTGIRAAIALAQGWQLARGIKLLGIGSVACLAAQAQEEKRFGRVNVVIDAQRNEVYLAAFEISPEVVLEAEPLRLTGLDEAQARSRAGEVIIGPEVDRWFEGARRLFPRARTLSCLAAGRQDFVSGDRLEPIYLRQTAFVKAPPPRAIA